MNVIRTCIYRKQLFLILCCTLLSVGFSFAQNPIVTENQLTGNPYSEWGLADVTNVFRDTRIAGFATQMSVNSGETVSFKIGVEGGADFTLKIYRIGYYNGMGARQVADLGTMSGTDQDQNDCAYDPATGLLDCSTWANPVSWNVPSNAVSGLYIAKLERTGEGSNHIVFIVRNDAPDLASGSDILLQFPDATWQAYNGYGGNSFYDGTVSGYPFNHAVKISYNRPFFIYNAGFNGNDKITDWYMNNEYSMIRWLESNGYDVTYTTNVDAASRPAQLLYHKIFVSLGHDEYWSNEQRDNVTAARNAGVHLAFFSGNEVYWKTRWEDSYRTLVCYKEGLLEGGSTDERVCGYKCDPTNIWTGLWRIGSAPYGNSDNYTAHPENELTGQTSWDEAPGAIQVPAAYKKLRFWRNTSIPDLGTGETKTLAPNTLGYEWDWEKDTSSFYPHGRIRMSSTTLNSHTHKLSLYRHSSGALVFGAGTVQWSWGLDGGHFGGALDTSHAMQQATVNLFADMGVQPETLETGLTQATQSTDFTAPTSAIVSLPGDPITPGSTVNVSGTSSDAGGGVVAGIEVSTDGGTTWRVANSSDPDVNITWDYSFTAPSGQQSGNIRVRGFDDSGNMGAAIGVTGTVIISVSLQGRPSPPNSQWQVPLQIDFYQNGNNTTPVLSYSLTTDQNGSVTINDIPTGIYTIAVKNSHTLKRVKPNQVIAAGSNLVVFSTLLEGDVHIVAAQSNVINIFDLGALLSSYTKGTGDVGFIANADLNGDGFVNVFDLGMLLSNYTVAGENP